MSNRDIREALLALDRTMTTQVDLGMVPRVNVVENTMTSSLRDFFSINPPFFLLALRWERVSKSSYMECTRF